MDIAHQYADVNGVRLHYASAGHGPLLIFLHGFPEFWYAWNAQIAFFSQSYHVIAPDMRGYNLSEKPSDLQSYLLPTLVADIVGLIDHCGQSRAIVVGHDWAGAVCCGSDD
jgi:pimeloyl-ACP methyl ester carboxylesterase